MVDRTEIASKSEELSDKIYDLSRRFAHEARYFQVCARSISEEGVPSIPQAETLHFSETPETLQERAHYSAQALVALSVQIEHLLSAVTSESAQFQDLDAQMRVLEELQAENSAIGRLVSEEQDKVQHLLAKIGGAMRDISSLENEAAGCAEGDKGGASARSPPSDVPGGAVLAYGARPGSKSANAQERIPAATTTTATAAAAAATRQEPHGGGVDVKMDSK